MALYDLLAAFVADFHGPDDATLATLKEELLAVVAPPEWRADTRLRIEAPVRLANAAIQCWGRYERGGVAMRVAVIVDPDGQVHTYV